MNLNTLSNTEKYDQEINPNLEALPGSHKTSKMKVLATVVNSLLKSFGDFLASIFPHLE